ncbi:hypothetical protein LTR85_008664 [Meristemomyces frigidus]|nr:hypothetical protein LTR85_008664 [Meristemomyces frigidus]
MTYTSLSALNQKLSDANNELRRYRAQHLPNKADDVRQQINEGLADYHHNDKNRNINNATTSSKRATGPASEAQMTFHDQNLAGLMHGYDLNRPPFHEVAADTNGTQPFPAFSQAQVDRRATHFWPYRPPYGTRGYQSYDNALRSHDTVSMSGYYSMFPPSHYQPDVYHSRGEHMAAQAHANSAAGGQEYLPSIDEALRAPIPHQMPQLHLGAAAGGSTVGRLAGTSAGPSEYPGNRVDSACLPQQPHHHTAHAMSQEEEARLVANGTLLQRRFRDAPRPGPFVRAFHNEKTLPAFDYQNEPGDSLDALDSADPDESVDSEYSDESRYSDDSLNSETPYRDSFDRTCACHLYGHAQHTPSQDPSARACRLVPGNVDRVTHVNVGYDILTESEAFSAWYYALSLSQRGWQLPYNMAPIGSHEAYKRLPEELAKQEDDRWILFTNAENWVAFGREERHQWWQKRMEAERRHALDVSRATGSRDKKRRRLLSPIQTGGVRGTGVQHAGVVGVRTLA